MSDTQFASDILSEGILEEEVPCEWCESAAELRSLGHRPACTEPRLKCVQCWYRWKAKVDFVLNQYGALKCEDCGKYFSDIKSFSDYREF
ncbi:hypothetical protein SEA_BOBBY_65 [Mycobacterium phage Bobby]|nr:hypothetical protein SEA_BOBBY_65 [Mycobacterium phage Bobby]